MRNHDEQYMQMAEIWATNSYAVRHKVGALIVKDDHIISDGYNGMPKGYDNCCEHEENGQLVTNKEVLHAEANAILKLAKFGVENGCAGATLYVTLSPCFDCAKLIIQSGIKRVVYRENYRNLEGIEFLKKSGIEVVKLDEK